MSEESMDVRNNRHGEDRAYDIERSIGIGEDRGG
jgi:hypothetical protein